MALPRLTDEERRANLSRAMGARAERAEMLRAVKAGVLTPAEVLARTDEVALRTPVLAFVRAWPGWGSARSQRLVAGLGIAPSRRLRGLGARQREALLAAWGARGGR